MAAVGGAWNWITPYKRPISLVDLSISFPFQNNETIPYWLVILVALVVPGVLIFIVCLFFIPGPTAKRAPRSLVWKRKIWEWNTGWMGLGLSLATAFLVTQGLKNTIGKARPDLLSRCIPDTDNIEQYIIGGYGQTLDARWMRVSADICTQTDKSLLDDGFRSWPSGHASFSWAGLLYLTLFLCSKFAIAIPFLPPRTYSQDERYTAVETQNYDKLPRYDEFNFQRRPKHESSDRVGIEACISDLSVVPIRNMAAAPPNYLLLLAIIPSAAAAYISTTRYVDFRHHGIDIVSGSLIGIVAAWFSFRWYHLPIRQGAGWAWGARSRDRAFGIGVGRGTYVGLEGWGSKKSTHNEAMRHQDIEQGPVTVDDRAERLNDL